MTGLGGAPVTPSPSAAQGGLSPRLPPAWRAQYVFLQVLVLLGAGVAALFVSWDSPILQALLAQIPALVTPGGIVLPSHRIVPLLLPLALGLPLALSRHRPPLMLWVALAVLLATMGVLEVARLNWAFFIGGVAFRVESGPVPLVRSLAGLALVLCGVLLVAFQSVQDHVAQLAGRGVPRDELVEVRRNLLRREQEVVFSAGAAGAGLLLVAAVSMELTERAPRDSPWFIAALVWSALWLAGVVGLIGWLARRRGQHP